MHTSAIIAAFGGHREVARVAGVHETRPFHWVRTGIPTRHWTRLVAEARALGLPITWEVLASATCGDCVHGADDTASGLRLTQHEPVNLIKTDEPA